MLACLSRATGPVDLGSRIVESLFRVFQRLGWLVMHPKIVGFHISTSAMSGKKLIHGMYLAITSFPVASHRFRLHARHRRIATARGDCSISHYECSTCCNVAPSVENVQESLVELMNYSPSMVEPGMTQLTKTGHNLNPATNSACMR